MSERSAASRCSTAAARERRRVCFEEEAEETEAEAEAEVEEGAAAATEIARFGGRGAAAAATRATPAAAGLAATPRDAWFPPLIIVVGEQARIEAEGKSKRRREKEEKRQIEKKSVRKTAHFFSRRRPSKRSTALNVEKKNRKKKQKNIPTYVPHPLGRWRPGLPGRRRQLRCRPAATGEREEKKCSLYITPARVGRKKGWHLTSSWIFPFLDVECGAKLGGDVALSCFLDLTLRMQHCREIFFTYFAAMGDAELTRKNTTERATRKFETPSSAARLGPCLFFLACLLGFQCCSFAIIVMPSFSSSSPSAFRSPHLTNS